MKTSSAEAEKILRLINRFLYNYAPSNLTESNSTQKNYQLALDGYLEWLEDEKGYTDRTLSLACFESPMIDDWMVWLKTKKGNSNNTCNVRLGSLRVFIGYLSRQDPAFRYLNLEAKKVERLKHKKNKEEAMSRDAVSALFSVPNTKTVTGRRYYLIMVLLYSTGIRIDELLSLTIGNTKLNDEKPQITVIGKGQKVRTLSLLAEPRKLLDAYIKGTHGDNPDLTAYVFYTEHKGKHEKISQNAIRSQLKRYAVIAHEECPDVPLDVHPHLFRRTKATHMIENGVNILQVSEFLGHENVATTMIYLNISFEEKNKAYDTIESDQVKEAPKKWLSKKGGLRDAAGTKGYKKQ